jgi:hypothetical protein
MRFVILLLFVLIAGTLTGVAQGDETTFTGEVNSIDLQRREIVVTPASRKRDAGGYDKKNQMKINVRLGWDLSAHKSFNLLLPPCVYPGNRIWISGMYLDDALFLAQSVHGCGAGNFSDKTGVRARLNRSRQICGP